MPIRILVVDDEPVIRTVVFRALTQQGYEVETAENGRVALVRLANGRYDIVVTDLLMPELGGLELLERMRHDYPLVRVIVMTGAVSLDNMLSCLKEGAFTFITKPLQELAPLIEAVKIAAWVIENWRAQLVVLQRLNRSEQAG